MKISVIIPIYNSEKYITRCIKSILAQTCSDFELLLIDDGSNDRSPAICDAFSQIDSRIKVLHIENNGVSNARNLGIKESKGEYITFIDSDDYVPENYLQVLLCSIESADISVCDISCVKKGIETTRFVCNKSLKSTEAIELLLSRRQINSGPYGKLFKRETIGNTTFPKMKAYEDILFVLEIFNKAKIINCTSDTVYTYDNSTGGAMTEYAKHPTTDVVIASEIIISFLNGNKDNYSHYPEYITFSHLMQHLQAISGVNNKTIEQKALSSAIVSFFKKHRKKIRKNKLFTFKEKLVYLFASRGLWINKRFKKI